MCVCKTGTLTIGKMQLQEDCPIFMEGIDRKELLRYAAMASRWKEPPSDALDTLVLNATDLKSLDGIKQPNFMPFDAVRKRTEATVVLPDKKTRFKVSTLTHTVLVCDPSLPLLSLSGSLSLGLSQKFVVVLFFHSFSLFLSFSTRTHFGLP